MISNEPRRNVANEYLPVILMGNEAIMEVAESTMQAEADGDSPRMDYGRTAGVEEITNTQRHARRYS